MDHNDKRNTSVPLGTFEETENAAPAAQAGQLGSLDHLRPQDPQGPHEGREDTWPNFTVGAERPRRRTRTLMGVPGLTGSDLDAFDERPSQPTDSADRATVPYPSVSENISQAIADALDGRERQSASAAQPVRIAPELDPEAQEVTTIYDSPEPLRRPAADAVGGMPAADAVGRMPAADAVGRMIEAAPPRESTIEILTDSELEPVRDSEIISLDMLAQPDLTQTIPELPPELASELKEDLASEPESPLAQQVQAQPEAARHRDTFDSSRSNTLAAPSLPAPSQPPDFSSLAPREVARLRSAPPPRRDRSATTGTLLVAAVMLLASGAWYLTSGTFRRASLTEAPAPAAATAAVTQPTQSSMDKPAESARTDTAMAKAPESVAPQQNESALATNLQPTPAKMSGELPGAAQPGPSPKAGKGLTATSRSLRVKSTPPRKPALVPPPPAGDGVPEQPTRNEVVERMETVRSSVRACAAGRSGVADLDITIAHTGAVMHVLVGGDFAGTSEGSCIARAVRTARFPSFKQDRFRVLFPYAI